MFDRFPRQTTLAISSAILVAAVMLEGCALRGADRAPLSPARVASVDSASENSLSYVMTTPSFALVASSPVGLHVTAAALQESAGAFVQLFGIQPPDIGVMVVDTTQHRSLRTLASPPASLTTITLVGAGLTGTGADTVVARASLERSATLLAATSWLGEYIVYWSDELVRHDIMPFAGRDGTLPDWFHAAVIHVVADPLASARAAHSMREHLDSAMPLETLFTRRIPVEDGGRLAVALSRDPAEGDETALFVDQATSVLRYLRVTRGRTAITDMMVPMIAGVDMREIMMRLPMSTSIERLDADWRRWVRAGEPVPDDA
ncbi:MAG: hypothetical protein JWN53_1375, partial [Gemmatimonadetes bacterium]|nr:hypothetical protein [Gemmatimonadota bacterium]